MKLKAITVRRVTLIAMAWFSALFSPALSQMSSQAPPKLETNPKPAMNVPVTVPDVPKLPWHMENGVKVFNLTAEIVRREILPANPMGPAKVLTLWGYNGSVPGPTIEVNEGDRVRIIFKNNLPEDTTVHWHGLEIPIAMDGMPFISQPPVKPGETFVYEFTLNQNGTYFYHSHGAMQEMMGMIGFFIIHPKVPYRPGCQKDFGIVLQEFAALPNNPIPNSMSMEFNWLTINGKAAPATTPMIVRLGDRVRIRMINIGMDHHPIHVHGNQFYVTGTEGGRIPQTAWFPGNTVLVGVAQARDVEFDAIHPGDWMLHCHLPHHMMNNMSSMVGPMTHVGRGLHTGMGMEEGMGIVREGSATSENLGPGLGRGMGITADRERALGNGTVGVSEANQLLQNKGGAQSNLQLAESHAAEHQEVARNGAMEGTGTVPATAPTPAMDMSGMQNMPGMNHNMQGMGNMSGMNHNMQGMGNMSGMQSAPAPGSSTQTETLPPAYPQDAMMMMPMDAAVAKPQTNYLVPGWSGALQGMMSLIRVLPPAEYDRLMADVRAGRTVQSQGGMDHGNMNMPGMDHSNMNMPGMDHSNMNMPGMDHGNMNMPGMDHSKMNMPEMDHSKMNMPGMDHGNMNMPGMDHSKMNMPGMDHSKMNMPGMDQGKPAPKVKKAPKKVTPRKSTQSRSRSAKSQTTTRKKSTQSRRPKAKTQTTTRKKSSARKSSSKRAAPTMDHSKMNMPGMDHSKMNMPGMDHSKMKM